MANDVLNGLMDKVERLNVVHTVLNEIKENPSKAILHVRSEESIIKDAAKYSMDGDWDSFNETQRKSTTLRKNLYKLLSDIYERNFKK